VGVRVTLNMTLHLCDRFEEVQDVVASLQEGVEVGKQRCVLHAPRIVWAFYASLGLVLEVNRLEGAAHLRPKTSSERQGWHTQTVDIQRAQ